MKGPSPQVAATRDKVLAARRDSRIGPNGSLAAQPLDTSLLQEGIRATQVAPAFTSVPPCGTAPERYGDDLARVPPFAPSPPAKEYVKINAVHLYFNADGTVAAQRAQETVSGEGKGRMRLTGVVPALKAEPACGTAEKLSSRNYTVTPYNQLGDRPFSAKSGRTSQEISMRYIDVKWLHDNEKYPIRLVSEIGSDDYEIRKLEFFKDGRCGFASEFEASLGVELGSATVPSLDEINTDCEFDGEEISQSDFERLWATVVG